MRVLIAQPLHEDRITQLENDIKNNKAMHIDVVLYPEGYLSNLANLKKACNIAKENHVMIITSYRKENKDIGVIIDNIGEIILERDKTSSKENVILNMPLSIPYKGANIGYLLCMELLKGIRDIKNMGSCINFIAHPIGVGMFSNEQFEQWITEAKKIAKTYHIIIFGTSHADGSFRNCGISIPISYCIDNTGEALYISKSDIRTRIVNLDTKEVEIIGERL